MADQTPDYCCDYRDHGSGGCACPAHELSATHPFGWYEGLDMAFEKYLERLRG